MHYWLKRSAIAAMLASSCITTALLGNDEPETTIWQFVRTIIGDDPSKPTSIQNDKDFDKIIARYNKNHDSDYLKKNLINTIIPAKRLDSEKDEKFYGKTPLIAAIMVGNEHAFNELLKHDADATMPDTDGKTPLHYAATHERLINVTYETAATKKHAHMIATLASKKASVTTKDKNGNNVLHAAVKANTPLIFSLLEDEIPYFAYEAENNAGATPPQLLNIYYGSKDVPEFRKIFNRAMMNAKRRARQ